MSNTVAETILAQLGGTRFTAMTGPKDLLSGEDHLQMRLPARLAMNGITHVKVRLMPNDTYSVYFMKWNARSLEMKEVSRAEGVYADNLRQIFTSHTGLYVSL